MIETMSKPLVCALLRHAEDLPWRMQDFGLMGLHLDDQRRYRLHLWDPSYSPGDPPIHDHPYDFTSTIVVGELTNTRYEVEPTGEEFLRYHYTPPHEDQRRADTVRLSGAATTVAEGHRYRQLAHELHASWPQPGTVTVMVCQWVRASELTVCIRNRGSWRSGHGRAATPEEIRSFATKALDRF